MAATVVLLGEIFDTNSGSHSVTATPNSEDLIIIVTAASGNTATTTPTDNNSPGDNSYILAEDSNSVIASALKNAGADITNIFIRKNFIQYGNSTTFTHNPGTSTGGGLAVYAIRGIAKCGNGVVRQVALQANQISGTPAPTFASAVLTGNPVISAVFNGTAPGGLSAKTGYTLDVNDGYITPTGGVNAMHINSGETGTAITWGSSSASAFASLAIELDTTITLLENQQDTFPGSSLDTTKWYDNTQSGGTQSVGSNAVTLTAPITTAGALAEVESLYKYDLTGSHAFVEVNVTDVGDVNAEVIMTVYNDETGNQLQLGVSNGTLIAAYQIAGTQTDVASIAYNATSMKWWRIRESGGTIYYDYSADAVTWTNLGSVADATSGLTITLVRTSCAVYDGSSLSSAEIGVFSNFNTVPATSSNQGLSMMGIGS